MSIILYIVGAALGGLTLGIVSVQLIQKRKSAGIIKKSENQARRIIKKAKELRSAHSKDRPQNHRTRRSKTTLSARAGGGFWS